MSDPATRSAPETAAFTISLQIKHPAIDPESISKELGLTPDHSWACGEPKHSSSSTLSGVRRNSFWCATLPPTAALDEPFAFAPREAAKLQRAAEMMSRDLTSYLSLQVMRLRKHQLFIQRLLDEGGELSFVIELPSADPPGFKLDPSVTRQLGTLGATLELIFA